MEGYERRRDKVFLKGRGEEEEGEKRRKKVIRRRDSDPKKKNGDKCS